MKKSPFYGMSAVRALAVVLLCLAGWGCASDEREANRFEFAYSYLASDLEMPEVCEKISSRSYLTGGVYGPDNFKSSYTRSDCYEHVALVTRDPKYCDQVVPRSRFPLGSINDPQTCREEVARGERLYSHGGDFDLLMDQMGFPEDMHVLSARACFHYPAPSYNPRKPHDIRNRVRFLPDFSQGDPDVDGLREQARAHDLAFRKAHVNDVVDGRTSLAAAAAVGDLDCLKRLLALGAGPTVKNGRGTLSLHEAAARGQIGAMRLLLDAGVSIAATAAGGKTPLHRAAQAGHIEAVDFLLEAGADLDARDREGRTPLSWAAESGQEAMMLHLMDRGADAELETSALVPLAVKRHCLEALKRLLAAGATLNVRGERGQLPLHLAASYSRTAPSDEMLRFLLDQNVPINARADRGRTPLHQAAEVGSPDAFRLLLERGADLRLRDADGHTPLDLGGRMLTTLIQQGAPEEDLVWLLELGIPPDQEAVFGAPLLHVAVKAKSPLVVEKLLARGVDPSARDPEGRTALEIAEALLAYTESAIAADVCAHPDAASRCDDAQRASYETRVAERDRLRRIVELLIAAPKRGVKESSLITAPVISEPMRRWSRRSS
jgi:ankyrin repeat protein